ncbi:hypothetical protein WG936_06595 [Corynebacterium sp. H127]|uniref:hypothetical protein n=1 Tax=Corynebacterium sp. H127 TaxID=3133418 RepID=UPI00309D1527
MIKKTLRFSSAALCCFAALVCTPLSSASPTELEATYATQHDSQALDQEIDKYTYTDTDGVPHFDTQAAQNAGASKTAIRAGEYINGFADPTATRGLDGFMNKWRYCGPNNSQPGEPQEGKPADEACRTHDVCLRDQSDLNAKKACDQALIDSTQHELDHNAGSYTWDEIAHLHAMKHAISWARDNCRVQNPPGVCQGKLL